MPHVPADAAVQFAHAVSGARELQRQHGHAERLILVLHVDAAQFHDFRKRHGKLAAEPMHGVIHQVRAEPVMASFHRCMRGKNALGASLVQRVLKVFPGCHFFADQFQSKERSMTFVHVEYGRGYT